MSPLSPMYIFKPVSLSNLEIRILNFLTSVQTLFHQAWFLQGRNIARGQPEVSFDPSIAKEVSVFPEATGEIYPHRAFTFFPGVFCFVLFFLFQMNLCPREEST